MVSELAYRNIAMSNTPQPGGQRQKRMPGQFMPPPRDHCCIRAGFFWPGMVGQFIAYLPSDVIIALLASLVMALIFLRCWIT